VDGRWRIDPVEHAPDQRGLEVVEVDTRERLADVERAWFPIQANADSSRTRGKVVSEFC
jgi:hypothetical protein